MIAYITGASGFLGKYVAEALVKLFDVYTIGRTNSNITIDIRFQKFAIIEPIDLFVHIAGKAHSIPYSKSEIQEFYNVNVEGTKNILESLTNNPPKKFVYISSVSVYGIYNGTDISEEDKLLANDPYGLSKILAEQIIIDWCKKNNVLCTILRLPLLVGINPPGNLKSMINAIRLGFYFNIAGGRARKSMVLASDVSTHIVRATAVGGIFNLTDGYHPNFKQLSHLISLQFGKTFVPNLPLFIAKLLAFFGDVIGPKFPFNSNKLEKITSTLTFNDEKARKAFGWNPSPVLEGFKNNIFSFRNNKL